MLRAALAFFMQAGFSLCEAGFALNRQMNLPVLMFLSMVYSVIETAKKVLYTGHIGYGKIYVYDLENVVMVRTGEEGYDALQDVE